MNAEGEAEINGVAPAVENQDRGDSDMTSFVAFFGY